MIRISVVVCTYNRAQMLTRALRSLVQQELDSGLYEIIVVDNNSNDGTRHIVNNFRRQYPNIRYIFEPRQGLSYARNRGWQEARGKYVGYVDDDCKIPENWLSVAKEIIEEKAPGVFGGPYFAFYNSSKPRWFKDSYGSHYQGNKARILAENEYLDGSNIFFRRELLEVLKGFDPSLGMSGRRIAYGEETALLRRIRATMPEQIIYYDSRLRVHHLVPKKKMSMRWIIRQRFADGRSSHLVFTRNMQVTNRVRLLYRVSRTILNLSLDLVQGIFLRDRTRYPCLQNYLSERTFRYIQQLGSLYEEIRSGKRKDNRL